MAISFSYILLQLASERVWRENESARRLGSNVFIDWHVWGCGTVFFDTFPGVDRLSFVEIACCAMKKGFQTLKILQKDHFIAHLFAVGTGE